MGLSVSSTLLFEGLAGLSRRGPPGPFAVVVTPSGQAGWQARGPYQSGSSCKRLWVPGGGLEMRSWIYWGAQGAFGPGMAWSRAGTKGQCRGPGSGAVVSVQEPLLPQPQAGLLPDGAVACGFRLGELWPARPLLVPTRGPGAAGRISWKSREGPAEGPLGSSGYRGVQLMFRSAPSRRWSASLGHRSASTYPHPQADQVVPDASQPSPRMTNTAAVAAVFTPILPTGGRRRTRSARLVLP